MGSLYHRSAYKMSSRYDDALRAGVKPSFSLFFSLSPLSFYISRRRWMPNWSQEKELGIIQIEFLLSNVITRFLRVPSSIYCQRRRRRRRELPFVFIGTRLMWLLCGRRVRDASKVSSTLLLLLRLRLHVCVCVCVCVHTHTKETSLDPGGTHTTGFDYVNGFSFYPPSDIAQFEIWMWDAWLADWVPGSLPPSSASNGIEFELWWTWHDWSARANCQLAENFNQVTVQYHNDGPPPFLLSLLYSNWFPLKIDETTTTKEAEEKKEKNWKKSFNYLPGRNILNP